MAKYRLTSDSSRSVDCDVLNESAGQYVVRFRNGVIRCVNKENVYAFDKIDEAVLDDIRDAASKVGGAIKKGYEKVKLAFSRLFMSGDRIVARDEDGQVLNAVPAGNVITSKAAQNAPITVIPGKSLVASVEAAGGRAVTIYNYEFGDDEYVGYSGDSVEESLESPNWSSAIYENKFTDVIKSLNIFPKKGDDDLPTGKSTHIKLRSDDEYVDMPSSLIVEHIVKEYRGRCREGEHYPKTSMRIWGAPGVGKSTIMKSLTNILGDDVTTIVINGNALGSHDLSQSGHVKVDMFYPEDEIGKNGGVGGDVIDLSPDEVRAGVIQQMQDQLPKRRMKKVEVDRINSLPQTWLPVYNANERDKKKKALEMDYANGGYYEEDGTYHEGKGGIIFIDEYSRLSQAAKNVLMTLPSDRTISSNGNMTIGTKWVVVTAANRPEDMSPKNKSLYLQTVEGADETRFTSVNYMPLPSEWFAWANKKTDHDRNNIEPEIVAYVKYSISQGKVKPGADDTEESVYDNYDNFSHSDYYNLMKNGKRGSMSKATPRTWEHFNAVLCGFTRYDDPPRAITDLSKEEITTLAYENVGRGPAVRFAAFIDEVYRGFSAKDARTAVTIGNTSRYEFYEKQKKSKDGSPWISVDTAPTMADICIIPRIMEVLETTKDDEDGFYSPDAIFNVLKFFAYLVTVVCNDGTASAATLFGSLVYKLKEAMRVANDMTKLPDFPVEIEDWRERTYEAISNNDPVDYSDIY